MNPYLDSQNNPRLKIEVLLSSWTTMDCLIDTGFSGGIALPEHFLAGFSQKPIVYQEYELTDDSLTTFAVNKTRCNFKNIGREITLFFTKSSDGLLGMEFLNGFKLVLDLKKFLIALE